MPIQSRREAIVTCDICHESYLPDWQDYEEIVQWAKESGWEIDASVRCPKCKAQAAPSECTCDDGWISDTEWRRTVSICPIHCGYDTGVVLRQERTHHVS